MFLMAAAGRHPQCVRDYDNWPLWYKIRFVQDEFDNDHNHQGQWHELCTMGNRDGPTSRVEARVWYHQRIRWQTEGASSKRDRYRGGHFQRMHESPWCCQIDYSARHGTECTSGIHGHWQCEDALKKASIHLQVKAEAQYLGDQGRHLEHQATGLRRCRQLRTADRLESQELQSLHKT